jgi:hypothetical protein
MELVNCFCGFDAYGNKMLQDLNQRSTINHMGELSHNYLLDYVCHNIHTKEMSTTQSASTIAYDPTALMKESDETNIDYELGHNLQCAMPSWPTLPNTSALVDIKEQRCQDCIIKVLS